MTSNKAVMGFVGVDTARSSIMRLFPIWAEELDLPARRLLGHDVPLGAPRETYRGLIASIKEDDSYLGALVTTHKVAVLDAAGDLFDELDEFSQQCGEVSSIYKRDGTLWGAAKDPITAGLALREFLPCGHFGATGGHVVCLGAGGAGTAISTYLAGTQDPPEHIVIADTSQASIDHVRDVHLRAGLPGGMVTYTRVLDTSDGSKLVADAPPQSLVINASGLGKDRPGSPIASQTDFPERAVVWEINYRGSLEFLHQAEAQEADRSLTVVDGWRYFIHGWSQVIGDVFDLDMSSEIVGRLSELAEHVR